MIAVGVSSRGEAPSTGDPCTHTQAPPLPGRTDAVSLSWMVTASDQVSPTQVPLGN